MTIKDVLIREIKKKINEYNVKNRENLNAIKSVLNHIYGEERNQIKVVVVDKIYKHIVDDRNISSTDGECTDEKYLVDTVDLIFKDSNINIYDTIIHFPELTITNSAKEKHKILDLFVKICFTTNLLTTGGSGCLRGTRTTFSKIEAHSGYYHSHLPSGFDTEWKKFCLGTGPIEQILLKLHTEFDIDDFTYLLHNLNIYVEWESTEGGPHMYMKNLALTNQRGVEETNILNDEAFIYIYNMFVKSTEFKEYIKQNNVTYIIREQEQELSYFKFNFLEEVLTKYIINNIDHLGENIKPYYDENRLATLTEDNMNIHPFFDAFLCFKMSNTYYKKLPTKSYLNYNYNLINHNSTHSFLFKTKSFQIKILEDESESESTISLSDERISVKPFLSSKFTNKFINTFTAFLYTSNPSVWQYSDSET